MLRINSPEPEPEPESSSIAWSPRFEVYSVDFGWGRPKKMEITSIDKTAAIFMSVNRNGN